MRKPIEAEANRILIAKNMEGDIWDTMFETLCEIFERVVKYKNKLHAKKLVGNDR